MKRQEGPDWEPSVRTGCHGCSLVSPRSQSIWTGMVVKVLHTWMGKGIWSCQNKPSSGYEGCYRRWVWELSEEFTQYPHWYGQALEILDGHLVWIPAALEALLGRYSGRLRQCFGGEVARAKGMDSSLVAGSGASESSGLASKPWELCRQGWKKMPVSQVLARGCDPPLLQAFCSLWADSLARVSQ